ncbi:MAG: hypothetical protein KC636_06945, partial [Myxococcales bacterium]|nr:hypothetical protein [Myxococcales bacterium]
GMRMPGPGRPGRVVRWLRRSSRQLRRLSTPARDAPLAAIDRARIDLCEAASTGLFAHDLTASSAFQARMLRLALEARDPDRIARAVALEALHHALGGATTAALTAQTLARARSLAARGEEPATARLIDYVHAASHLLRGAFDAAARACEALRPEYDHRARERAWERTNLRAHALTCAVIRGAYTEVASELSAWIADARGRGDTYAEALATRLATWIALARGDAGALPKIQEARALYRDAPRGQLSTQLALTEAAARVATGDRAAAGDILDQLWAPMTRAAVWELQALRVEAHFIRGLARLGRGDAGDDVAALERERFTGAAELAAVLRAGQLRSEGPELAQRRLDEATTDLARAGLQLHASLARRLASPRA